MAVFCASVSWRVLVYHIDTTHLRSVPAALLPSVERAELTWREFLLGSRPRPQPHEQHILPLPRGVIGSHTYSDMPTNINRYLFRSSEMTVASNDRDAFTYAKLGPFIILGFIAMPRPKQWVGTRVNTHGGNIGPRNYVLPKPFDKFIFERAESAATLQERISDRQHAKIAETYSGNMDRAAQSDSMQAMHQDVEQLRIQPRPRADVADDRGPGMDSYSGMSEVDAAGPLPGAEAVSELVYRQGGADGSISVVYLRERCAEKCEHGIADELVHHAALRKD